MHEPGADCKDLIETTTDALSSEELQQLFLSTQQNNVEVCIKYGIKRWGTMIFLNYYINMIPRILDVVESDGSYIFKVNNRGWMNLMVLVLLYFPQIVVCIWSHWKKPLTTDWFLQSFFVNI